MNGLDVMEKKQIPIIALAVFSISLLSMFAFITNPYNMAYAVSASDFTFGSVNNNVFYQEAMGTYVILQQNTVASASTNLCFLDAQSESPSTEQNCVTIFPQQGGCDVDPSDGINYNPCSATDGTTDCDTDFIGADPCSNKTGLTGLFQGLWCGTTYCFLLFDQSTGGWSSQLIRVWSLGVGSTLTGDVSGYRNITSTWALATSTWGYDECTGTSCGIGGITFFWASDKAGTDWFVHKEGGTSLMGTVAELNTAIPDASAPIRSLEGCRHCGDVVGTTRVFVSAPWNSGTSRQVQLINGATMTNLGTYSTNSLNTECTGSGVGGATTTSVGSAVYMGDTINRFAYNVDTGIIFFSAVDSSVDPADCILKANFNIIDFVRGLAIDEENSLWYMWHGSGQPLGSITQFNLTSYSVVDQEVDFDADDATIGDTISGWVDGGMPYQSMDVAFDVGTILMTSDSAKARLLYLNNFVGEEDEVPQGNQQDGFCGVGTLRDCLGDQDALSGLVPANQNITSVATTIGQGIGIINPNDENPRTNGTGLWLMLITGSFFAIALMSTVHTLNMRGFISASVKEIDPIFWLFLVVATVSLAWYLDWIDDIIFYAMTVGLSGLVAFGVLKHLGRV